VIIVTFRYHRRDRDAKTAEKKNLELDAENGDLKNRLRDAENAKKRAETDASVSAFVL